MRAPRRTGLTEETFHRLVDLAYEAGAEAERWPAFLAEYTEALGDRTASLIHQDLGKPAGSVAFSFRTDPAWERSYAETYGALNPWTVRGADLMQTGTVLSSRAIIANRDLKRSEFFEGFLKKQEILYSLAAVVERAHDTTTFVAVQRSERAGPFDDAELRFVRPLMPHLRCAIELHRRLGAARVRTEVFAAVAERLHEAVFFVGRNEAVLFANAAAARLGRVLTKRILGIAARGDGVVRTADDRPLFVRVVMLRAPGDRLGVPAATRAIFVVDPERQRRLPAVETLRAMYGLTAAEAAIVLALARGATLREIAAETSRDLETLRSQIKRAFDKTGARRQSELVARVLSLVPPL